MSELVHFEVVLGNAHLGAEKLSGVTAECGLGCTCVNVEVHADYAGKPEVDCSRGILSHWITRPSPAARVQIQKRVARFALGAAMPIGLNDAAIRVSMSRRCLNSGKDALNELLFLAGLIRYPG